MSQRKKDKVDVDGGDPMAVNAFGALSSSGLPSVGSQRSGPPTRELASGKSKGRVEIRREKAGRGGKTVTTLRGFPSHLSLATLEAMTFDLKKICACGGTLKGRVIELQGDERDKVCKELGGRGFQVVRAGG